MSLTDDNIEAPASREDFAEFFEPTENPIPPTIELSRCEEGVHQKAMVPWSPSWDRLCETFGKATVGTKHGSYFVRGPCSVRENANMAIGALLIIDGDRSVDLTTGEILKDCCVPPRDAHESLARMGITNCLFTTHSHDGPGKNKWRAAIPAELRNPAELAAMANWIIERLNADGVPILFVSEMSTWTQPWFMPRVRSEDAPFEFYRHDEAEGHIITRTLIERVTKEWQAEGSDIHTDSERGSQKNENTPIGRFLQHFDNSEFVIDMLEQKADCLLDGSDMVNGKQAYRLLPPDSESGVAGIHVYRGRTDGTWLTFSHNASFEIPGKVLDAFGVYQWLEHGNNLESALAGAALMVAIENGEIDYQTATTEIDAIGNLADEAQRLERGVALAQRIDRSKALLPEAGRQKLLKALAKAMGTTLGALREDIKQAKTLHVNADAFLRNDLGAIIRNAVNTGIAVSSPKIIGYEIGYDTFREQIMRRRGGGDWEPFADDALYFDIRVKLDQLGFESTSAELVKGAVRAVAKDNQFDSLRDWVTSLVWDGKARVRRFMADRLLAEDSEYSEAVGLYTWTALAARALTDRAAGEKADMVPIWIGAQGLKKSTMLKSMVPIADWHVELNLGDRDAELVRKMRGRCVFELEELAGLGKRDQQHLKSLFSKQTDNHREVFSEFTKPVVRRGLMVGTSNETEILADHSGHRRYLPAMVGVRDAVDVFEPLDPETRDQLWAEGADLFREYGILFEQAERLAKEIHQYFLDTDAWQEPIGKWLDGEWRVDRETERGDFVVDVMGTNADRLDLTTTKIADLALDLKPGQLNKQTKERIRNVMGALGFEYKTGVMRGPYDKGTAWRKK